MAGVTRRVALAVLVVAILGGERPSAQPHADPLQAWRLGFPGSRTTEPQRADEPQDAASADDRQRLLIRVLEPRELPPGVYFYVERAVTGRRQRPLQQEVWRVTVSGPRVVAERFAFKVPARFLGMRSSETLSAQITVDDLVPRPGCDLHFTALDDGWDGVTSGTTCKSATQGHVYVRAHVNWNAERLVLDEREVDASTRERADSSRRAPYEFRPEAPLESSR